MDLLTFLSHNPEIEHQFHWQIYKRDKKCYICSLEIEGVMLRTTNVHKNGYFCPYGKKGEEIVWFNMDHIIPKSRGGANTYANTRACCIPCNEKKAAELPSVSDNKQVPSDYEVKILKKSYNKKLKEDLPPWEPYYGF